MKIANPIYDIVFKYLMDMGLSAEEISVKLCKDLDTVRRLGQSSL